MKRRKWIIVPSLIVILLIVIGIILYQVEPEYAYIPPKDKVLNDNGDLKGYDVWGVHTSGKEATILKTEEGKSTQSPASGAVKIDDELLELGREAFYQETFGNEVFLTDIMGIVDGAFTIPNAMKAILALGGEGTTNLRVELAEDVTIGDKQFEKGTKIDTGMDVPKGSYAPLGMPVTFSEGRLKVGISCAACHATVDRNTHKVLEGAPNRDLNAGLLIALSTNSAAYLTHTDISSLKAFLKDMDRTVETSDGKQTPLPDPKTLEKAVDRNFLKWPKGNFDSTIDMKSNLTQIPDSFTIGDHPYGWSGFAQVGAFKGLSTFINNVHAQNSDSLSQSEASKALFGMDKEVYLGTLLQNAANEKYRYNPSEDETPSEFFASVDPTPGVPGVNELVALPQFPKVSAVAPDGLIVSSPGYNFNEQNNGMSAWQNTIVPPNPDLDVERDSIELGERVFSKAGCISCHAGRYLTNNKIIPVNRIGTEPSRAAALKKTGKIFGKSVLYSPDTPVPIPENPKVLEVPVDKLDPNQIKLGFAHGNSPGGYKVPSLNGLFWSAPYLHDGGVAVGTNLETELGAAGTTMKGIPVDPRNSLLALIDKSLRMDVIQSNRNSKDLQSVHVDGSGHEFWVDESTRFTKKEQQALIDYLLSINIGK
ncbi:electron transport protein [Pseudalkalibacillus decolorationis]|uniref:electron transport protein n=1 Tax=Pseudalkalibacillus decolorationis TaxID=163879 RepID=UPI0021476111|nr:electron transport protein [Pseudalkalibacillus decolorationis]